MNIDPQIGLYSFAAAMLAYLLLTALLVITWQHQAQRKLIVLASLCSLVWAACSASAFAFSNMPRLVLVSVEFARSTTWCLFLLHVIDLHLQQTSNRPIPHKWALFVGTFLALLATVAGYPLLQPSLGLPGTYHNNLSLSGWIGVSIAGLLMIEQLYRNTETGTRWSVKHLCLGVGGLFAYDFYMYADALLFGQVNPALWSARGAINAIAVPLIAISAARNPEWNLGIHVSRRVIFHSATLMGTGIYLTAMASAGYFIKIYGGSWGNILQITFLFGAVALLIVLLFSGKIRAKSRVFLSKHFFSYRYDYREEWLRFTQTLADSGDEIPETSIKAIANLVDSPGGWLWMREQDRHFELLARHNVRDPGAHPRDTFDSLLDFLEKNQWIIDLQEYQLEPDRYEDLALSDFLTQIPNAWLIIPLIFQSRVQGILMLETSQSHDHINWEDRDLLKMASFQVATHLSQYKTNQDLMQARQFDAFNRLSAYIVHDLKNILGQQSLLVANASKHKHKPAFIDDVIHTLENSVQRMTALMDQLRTGDLEQEAAKIDLKERLSEAVQQQNRQRPSPVIQFDNQEIRVQADPRKLTRVLGHLIQNAQEATPDDGRIEIELSTQGDEAHISIKDNGCGMSQSFIQDRLFKPFDSTKGLTGMGIGVFESREYIRTLGGDILVSSEPTVGSKFTVVLPR